MTPDAAELAHDELRELLGVYALDALRQDERAALRAHLAGCPECRAELAELRMAVANLPLLLDELESPPALRGRLEADLRATLAANAETVRSVPTPAAVAPSAPGAGSVAGGPPVPPVGRERALPMPVPVQLPRSAPTPIPSAPSRRPVLPWAAAAALLLVVSVGMLLWNLRLQDEAGRTAVEVARLRDEAGRAAGETVALVPGEAAPAAAGEVRLAPDEETIVLDVRDLPPLAPGEVYQVWLIGEGDPVPSGVFAGPTARHAIAADAADYETLAITNEPGPLGSPGPTGEIVATAPLGG